MSAKATPSTIPASPLTDVSEAIANSINNLQFEEGLGEIDIDTSANDHPMGVPENATTTTASEIIKLLIARRDTFTQEYAQFLLGNNLENLGENPGAMDNAMDLLISNIDKLNKHIAVVTESIQKTEETMSHKEANLVATKNASSSNREAHSSIGLRLTPNDMPRFQIHGDIQFPGKEAYDSVEHFLRAFEKVIYSSGLEIDSVWKRFIQRTLSMDYDIWMRNKLLVKTPG